MIKMSVQCQIRTVERHEKFQECQYYYVLNIKNGENIHFLPSFLMQPKKTLDQCEIRENINNNPRGIILLDERKDQSAFQELQDTIWIQFNCLIILLSEH